MDASRDNSDLAGAAVRAYLREIRTIPTLTAERERALAQRTAQGDADAARDLVCAHLRLVVSLARSFAGRGLPLDDLIQEGNLGLLRAVRRFDWRRGARFAGYAVHRIRGALCDAVETSQAGAVT